MATKHDDSARKSILEDIEDGLNKKFGKGSSERLSEQLDLAKNHKYWFKTGMMPIDLIVSDGRGLPGGVIIEVSGPEGCGKTTMVKQWAARFLRTRGGIFHLQDTERSENPIYSLEGLGMDLDYVSYSKPETIEEVFAHQENVINSYVASGTEVPLMMAWDSLAGTPTKAEAEGEPDDQFMAIAARVIKQNLRRLQQKISKKDIYLIIINQIYDKIGVQFGEKTTTYGGRGLRYHAGVRIAMNVPSKISEGSQDSKRVIGQNVELFCRKTRFAPPFQKKQMELIYGQGMREHKFVMEAAAKLKIIEKAGAYYSFKDERIPAKFYKDPDTLREYKPLWIAIRKKVSKVISI